MEYGICCLNGLGFLRGDRIAVVMPAGPATAVVSLTVMAGFTSAPLNPNFRAEEFGTYFSRLKIRAIITEAGFPTAAREVALSRSLPLIEVTPSPTVAGAFTFGLHPPADTRAVFGSPSDTALLLPTSGTTSLPKIVPFTQQQLCASATVHASLFHHGRDDRSLHIVPYYHLLGLLGTFLSPLSGGGTVICTKNYTSSDFPSLLRDFRPTFYIAGPAHHQAILGEIRRMSPEMLKGNSLRLIRSTTAALPVQVLREIEERLGVTMVESYAMTESPYISVNIPYREGSVGIPMKISLIIADDDGTPLPPGTDGEILIRGPGVFSGYEDAPAENAAAFRNGWFRTGDMGCLDPDGYLYISGRKKELINKGGEKISPAEIDAVLLRHPGVAEAMAFRIDDPLLGEDVAAMVVAADEGLTEEDLREYLIDRLAVFKVPKRIYRVDQIPRGGTGKPLRFVGTERYGRGPADPAVPPQSGGPGSAALAGDAGILAGIWKEVLAIPSLTASDDFFRCGGNSLTAIELLIRIQRRFRVSLPADTIYRFPTIREQTALLCGRTGGAARYHPLIVPIRSGGTLPPLFCINPLGGWIREYQYMARYLDPDRPIFGVRARGLEVSEEPLTTVGEAAREYADALRSVQERGPYQILGFSGGAIYAFDLACRLQSRGEQVSFLGILDMSLPAPQWSLFNLTRTEHPSPLFTAAYSLYTFISDRLHGREGGLLHRLFTRSVTLLSRMVLRLRLSRPSSPSAADARYIGAEEDWIRALPPRQQQLVKTQFRAISLYRAGKFHGDIHLFSTGPDDEFYPGDPSRGWTPHADGRIVLTEIPGSHNTLHTEPLGQVTAARIEARLHDLPG